MQRPRLWIQPRHLLVVAWAAVDVAALHPTAALLVTAQNGRADEHLGAGIPSSHLFGACISAIQKGQAPGNSIEAACRASFGAGASTVGAARPRSGLASIELEATWKPPFLAAECARFAGRAAEASEEGYLGNGGFLCGRLTRERALTTSTPLAAFFPEQGDSAATTFCHVMRKEALEPCRAMAAEAAPGESVALLATSATGLPRHPRGAALLPPPAAATAQAAAPPASASALQAGSSDGRARVPTGGSLWANLQTLARHKG